MQSLQNPDLLSSSLTLNWIKWLQNLRLNSYAIPLNSKRYEESLNLTQMDSIIYQESICPLFQYSYKVLLNLIHLENKELCMQLS